MNHRVPELNMGDEDYSPPSQNKVQEDSIMELLWSQWRDGQVVVQTQNPRLVNQSSPPPPPPSAPDSWLEGRDLYQCDSRTNTQLRETTVVDSCDTPAVNLSRMEVYSRSCDSFSGTVDGTSSLGDGCMSISMSMSRDAETILTSSPDGSSDSDTPPPVRRKRKSREPHDDATTDYHTERRRNKINEKLKALQDLIPRCSKTDKVSTLDEAIQYLKELQIQVQVMAIGCGMVPMMFPGAQQYMPTMGMGIGMPMGMGMTHPMIPYQAVLSGSCLPTPGAPSQMDPRFPLNAFQVPQLHFQPSKQADAFVNPLGMPGHNVAMTPSLAEAYQQYIAMQKIPMQIPETQPTLQPGTGEESTSSDDQDDE